ncbi:hypothetical protein M427DRAFT_252209 [Gonapodya prolifera JEL478]|uniref:Uncharacterized protein n=1 Tax=Gonapodya prolifera (strain JEL478) TaxID=1344416 RepID=A0A139ALA3_GONPJ|nr:hypothetical protein M427DRAFT_252209 [Gonapodya prolifera JEL478]|eukprot:KXS17478.1 hypothetical protein M427DRAFT_252209 [Gonapodya prolifera JEL478]
MTSTSKTGKNQTRLRKSGVLPKAGTTSEREGRSSMDVRTTKDVQPAINRSDSHRTQNTGGDGTSFQRPRLQKRSTGPTVLDAVIKPEDNGESSAEARVPNPRLGSDERNVRSEGGTTLSAKSAERQEAKVSKTASSVKTFLPIQRSAPRRTVTADSDTEDEAEPSRAAMLFEAFGKASEGPRKKEETQKPAEQAEAGDRGAMGSVDGEKSKKPPTAQMQQVEHLKDSAKNPENPGLVKRSTLVKDGESGALDVEGGKKRKKRRGETIDKEEESSKARSGEKLSPQVKEIGEMDEEERKEHPRKQSRQEGPSEDSVKGSGAGKRPRLVEGEVDGATGSEKRKKKKSKHRQVEEQSKDSMNDLGQEKRLGESREGGTASSIERKKRKHSSNRREKEGCIIS